MSQLAGIDLAWRSNNNGSAVAVGELSGKVLKVIALQTGLVSLQAVMQCVRDYPDLQGIAIDAPLIIPNATGQRTGERELSSVYGSRKASCHTSNLGLYPDAESVCLSVQLEKLGFRHLAAPDQHWQMECYPHPAMIEVFGLPERLLYKKGNTGQKKAGQIRLAGLLRQLRHAEGLSLQLPEYLSSCLDPGWINSLKGIKLKHNEDQLDALFCLYIAGMYQLGLPGRVFGDVRQGYIQVPAQQMLTLTSWHTHA